jgi:soluble lytic murein transglycosylase-like protein
MALTQTLNDVSPQGINIVSPPQGGGGFLSSLARFGSGVVGVAGKTYAQGEAKETQAAQNDAAQLVQDKFKAATERLTAEAPVNETTPVAFDSSLDGVPQDAVTAGKRLNRIQQGVNQGSVPRATLDLELESGIDELYRKHPERKAVIAQYLASQGLDHYLFREFKAAVDYQTNAQTLQREQEDANYTAAVSAGLVNPETVSRSEAVRVGQEYRYKTAQIALAKDQLTMAKTRAEIVDLDRKNMLSDGKRNLVSGLIGEAQLRTNQLAQGLSQLTIEAANDPSGQKNTLLKDALPAVQQGILTAKTAAIGNVYANGGEKEEADAVGAYYDTILESVVKAHTGDLSRDSLNQKVLQGMQTQFGIDAAKAFPLWNQLTKLPGMANTLPLLFGGDPGHQLSKEQQEQIKKELNGWAPASPTGLYYVQRVADVLRGDTKLSQLSLPDAQKVIGSVNTAVQGNGTAILAGDKTEATVKPFLTGFEQLSDAAFSLTPGVDPKSQYRASQMLSNRDSVQALVAMTRDPIFGSEATQTVVSLRATAQKGILTAKTGDWQHGDPGSLTMLIYDEKAQTVKRVINEQAYKNFSTSSSLRQANRGIAVEPPTREQVLLKADRTLDERAKTINNYLDTMVRTAPADPNVPKGLTPRDVRKAAFLGMPVDQAGQAGGKDDFQARVKALEDQAARLNLETIAGTTAQAVQQQDAAAAAENQARYEPVAHKAADKYGVPKAVASFLFGQESNWNPAVGGTKIDNNGDGKPDSTAMGIGQWTKSSAIQYGLVVEKDGKIIKDDRGDANKSIDASMRYLSDLYRKLGSWEKALEAYGVTARSNFKDEQAYQSVIGRARSAIEGAG